jgi:uncharacterized protein YjbI with pentapeptide repeats
MTKETTSCFSHLDINIHLYQPFPRMEFIFHNSCVRLEHAVCINVRLEHAVCINVRLEHAVCINVRLEHAVCINVRLDHAVCINVRLKHAVCLNVRLEHAVCIKTFYNITDVVSSNLDQGEGYNIM